MPVSCLVADVPVNVYASEERVRRLVGILVVAPSCPDLSSLSLAQRGTRILDVCFNLRVLIAPQGCEKPVQSHFWRRSSRRRNLRCPKTRFSNFLDVYCRRTGCWSKCKRTFKALKSVIRSCRSPGCAVRSLRRKMRSLFLAQRSILPLWSGHSEGV